MIYLEKRILKQRILQKQVISFDIFDTLIYRRCGLPTGIFDLVKNSYEMNSGEKLQEFTKIRIEAEKRARKIKGKVEITLEDIYKCMPYSVKKKKILKQLEIDTEIDMAMQNKDVKEIFDFCKEKNKEIYLISDMYLEYEVINRILLKCEYEGKYNLCISSEYGCKKRQGELYDRIAKRFGISRHKWLHIGDDIKADYIQAKRKGVASFLIKKSPESYISSSALNNVINLELSVHKSSTKNTYWNIGYELYGPLLYGYTVWLHKNIMNDGIDQILFVARDGYIVKQAYDILFENDTVKSTYFYISRKSTSGYRLKGDYSVDSLFRNAHLRKHTSLAQFWDRYNISYEEYCGCMEKAEIKSTYSINPMKAKSDRRFMCFLNNMENIIKIKLNQQAYGFQEYVKQTVTGKKIAVVDVGYHGTFQKILSEIFDTKKIYGYYVGLLEIDKQNQEYAKGYGLTPDSDNDVLMQIRAIMGLLDIFFSAPQGSVESYQNQDREVIPVIGEYEYASYPEDDKALGEMRDGALEAVKWLKKSNLHNKYYIDSKIAFGRLISAGIRPKRIFQENIGKLHFMEGQFKKIACPMGWEEYLYNPSKFLVDFADSVWKIGFMKGAFKICLPYYLFYRIMAKRQK